MVVMAKTVKEIIDLILTEERRIAKFGFPLALGFTLTALFLLDLGAVGA
jgi:hypothetical protein